MRRHRLIKLWRAEQAAVALGDWMLATAALTASGAARPGAAAVAALWVTVLYAFGLYDFSLLREPRSAARWLAAACVVDALFAAALRVPRPWWQPAASCALTHAASFAWRLAWLRILRTGGAYRVAFIGDGPLVRAMSLDVAAARHPGLRLVQWPGILPAASPRIDRWAPGASVPLFASKPDLLVIDRALKSGGRFAAAFTAAVAAGVPAMEDLEFYEALYRKVAPRAAATPEWLLHHVLPRRSLIYPPLKRALDLAGAAVLLVVLFPVIAMAALMAAADGGPVLYRQRRVGLLGREFMLLKFRSMSAAGREQVFSDHPNDDPRVTYFGRVLRRFRLDELPQLWNVLAGDMSLIGPRPERPEVIVVLERAIPGYHLRHLVKPGMTGWAQVNFRATNLPDGTLEKLRYDLYYLKHLSPNLDAAILLRTVKRLLQPESVF